MSIARSRRDARVAIVEFDHQSLNPLSRSLRAAIAAEVEAALADPAVDAIVLAGNDRAFSSGADIKEFDTPEFAAEPNLWTLIRLVEEAHKPIVAAISGVCMGGGLELALGCHHRVARGDAKIAFPEVKLGLIPGAGGTQRMPRVAGLEAAVNLICSGNTVPASIWKGSLLFDEIVKDDPVGGAVALARRIVAAGQPIRRVRALKVKYPQADAYLQFARNGVGAVARGMPAPLKALDAIAAAVEKPFDQGMEVEATIFRDLVVSPESKALRHAFFAERAAGKISDVPESTRPRTVASVAIIGAGTMGGGIAMNFINAGIPVQLLEVKQEALDRGLATVRRNYESSVKKGRMTPEELEKRLQRIRPTLDYAAIGQADLVIEAVFEDLGVKEQVFRRLDEVMKPGAILATNTSTLDVDRIAGFTKRPEDVVGLHFFSPANVMKLLEVVRGAKTSAEVLATAMAVAKTIGKTAVVARVCDGFIGNRMIEQYSRQALFMLEEGASPAEIDRAVEKFGFAMGPFRMSDLAGNDIGWHIRKRRYVEHPGMKYPRVADRLCELGRFGQKTGSGWYRYEPGRRDALPDPVVDQLVAEERRTLGIAPRRIPEHEIVHRLVFALVNEGARILEEGIAQRASDIDIVYLTGYGFPVYRGGPMFHADQLGLYNVVRWMREFAANPHGDPQFWQPARLLTELAATGGTLTSARATP